MAKWGTKNPPQKKGRYWITYLPYGVLKDMFPGRHTTVADRVKEFGSWKWDNAITGEVISEKDVIAWQKLPDPYNGPIEG